MARPPAAGTPALVALHAAGVAHTTHRYEHDPTTVEFGREAAAALDLEPSTVFKTLLAEVDTAPVVAIVPVDGMLDLKALAAARGAKRGRLMEAAAAQRVTGYVVGGISPFGQRTRLPTVLDRSALDLEVIYVSGGRRGLDIGIAPLDLMRLLDAEVADISTSR